MDIHPHAVAMHMRRSPRLYLRKGAFRETDAIDNQWEGLTPKGRI
mgnify:CR=1 FL=1